MEKDKEKRLISAGKLAAVRAPLPDSLNWLYGLGFKLGVFIMLKCFLVLKTQILNLSSYGVVLCGAQMLLAGVLIACGAAAQSSGVFSDPARLHTVNYFYLLAFIVNASVLAAGRFKALDLFVHAGRQSFLTELFSGLKSFSLDLLFFDTDLWTLAALLIYMTGSVYLLMSFGTDAFKTANPALAKRGIRAFGVLAAILCVVLVIAPAISHLGKAQLPAGSESMRGRSFEQLAGELSEAGFENISISAEYKLFSMYVNGSVKSVEIDGSGDFLEAEWYPRDSEIRLVYYSNYRNISNLIKLAEGGREAVQCPEGSFGWQSEDASVASVDDTGMVTAVTPGETRVSFFVKIGDLTVRHSCKVEVYSLNPVDWAGDLLKMLPEKGGEE